MDGGTSRILSGPRHSLGAIVYPKVGSPIFHSKRHRGIVPPGCVLVQAGSLHYEFAIGARSVSEGRPALRATGAVDRVASGYDGITFVWSWKGPSLADASGYDEELSNSEVTNNMISRQLLAVCVLFCGGTLGLAQETTGPAKLAFSPGPDGTFMFDTGVVRGRVHSDGRGFGLNDVEHVTDGQPMSGAIGLLNVYRVFSDGTRYGNAGWEWPNQAELGADGAVTVKCAATPDRPFDLQGTYRWVSPSRIDLELLVTPVTDLKNFEVFVASYFDKAFTQSAAYVNENPQADGKPGFMSAKQELGNWLMFPRDPKAVAHDPGRTLEAASQSGRLGDPADVLEAAGDAAHSRSPLDGAAHGQFGRYVCDGHAL